MPVNSALIGGRCETFAANNYDDCATQENSINILDISAKKLCGKEVVGDTATDNVRYKAVHGYKIKDEKFRRKEFRRKNFGGKNFSELFRISAEIFSAVKNFGGINFSEYFRRNFWQPKYLGSLPFRAFQRSNS